MREDGTEYAWLVNLSADEVAFGVEVPGQARCPRTLEGFGVTVEELPPSGDPS